MDKSGNIRKALTELADAVFGRQAGDEPDVYADYDHLCSLERSARSALSEERAQPVYEHIEAGGRYQILFEDILIKDPHCGGETWFVGIAYINVQKGALRFGQVYATTKDRFESRFRVVNG